MARKRSAPAAAALVVALAIATRAGATTAEPAAPLTAPRVVASTVERRVVASAEKPEIVPGRALVDFRPGTADRIERAAHVSAGTRVLATIGTGYRLVGFPSATPVSAVVAAYRAIPAVAVAEPDYVAHIALAPDDPCVGGPCNGSVKQYSLDVTNARAGWDVFPGRFYSAASKLTASTATVAVLDTHVDRTHPDFANPGGSADSATGGQLDLADAKDWIPSSAWSGSGAYHGTYIAGLVGAASGNGADVAAIGYAARIMPLTVVDGSGRTDAASLADGIVYAWQHGARVVNMSLGLTADSQAVHDALRQVTSGTHPVLAVAAAGNNANDAPFYPGSYPEVMGIAGTNAADRRAPCSNFNANVSVSAPADHVVSLAPMPGETTTAACGTSAATAQVSGLGALLFAQDPTRTPARVRAIIERSADDLGPPGRDDNFGWGRINVERALRYGDGSPVVDTVAASVPKASGGPSVITAVAHGSRPITSAELRLDSPSASPITIGAADGAFGGTSETLRGSVQIAKTVPEGPHPFWIRAFDGSAWGPYAVGVILVDRSAPKLTNLAASNGNRPAGQPVQVTFTAADAVSQQLAYAIQFFEVDASKKLVFQDLRTHVPGGPDEYDWSPGSDVLPGHYEVHVVVADEAGNLASGSAGVVLV